MSLGNEWTASTPGSVSKLNNVTLSYGTGAYLAGLDKTKHKLVVCTSTGSGFTVDHVYLADSTGTTWVDLSVQAAHTHSSSSDGGKFDRILGINSIIIDLILTKTQDLKKAQWIETVTSTGTIEDNTDGGSGERAIRLRTNGTSGATATISYPHLILDWTKPAYFSSKVRIETATSIAGHVGVGADDTSAADSNTRKVQPEFCTTVNNNWFLRTANGSANSSSDSGIAITATRDGIGFDHRPDLGTPEADLWIDATNVVQKTSNIPITSITADNNLIKFSVKNNTPADRPLLVYGCRLSYNTGDTWVYRS